MDPTVQERGTYPAQRMIDSFFSELPTDSRYVKVQYQQVVPHTAIDKNSTNIEFILNSLDAPFCYQISDILMMVTIVITKKDGTTLPDTSVKVAPCNNVIGSLFYSNVMKINDDPITSSGEMYPYKCFISKNVTFSADVKTSVLMPSGWIDDSVANEEIEAKAGNYGFEQRSTYFRQGFKAGNAYRPGNLFKTIFISIFCFTKIN